MPPTNLLRGRAAHQGEARGGFASNPANKGGSGVSQPVVEGKVLSFDATKGYGFISPRDGGDDVFFHVNHLTEPHVRVLPGSTVSYIGELGSRGPVAYMVRVLHPLPRNGGRLPPDGEETVSREEFLDEVTDVLVNAATDLRAAELREIREALANLAQEYGWIA